MPKGNPVETSTPVSYHVGDSIAHVLQAKPNGHQATKCSSQLGRSVPKPVPQEQQAKLKYQTPVLCITTALFITDTGVSSNVIV